LRITKPLVKTEFIVQEQNRNTQEDLYQSLFLAIDRGMYSMTIITIELHLPRIKTFYNLACLKYPKIQTLPAVFKSAEEILIKRHRYYKNLFYTVRLTEAWKRTLAQEQQGISDLKNGIYRNLLD